MNDFLVDHAIRNVWCSPGQDLQAIIKPKRLSPKLGVWNYINTVRRAINLPTTNDRYHVYHIGQLYPLILGLAPVELGWLRFSDVCKDRNLFADIYNADGIHAPLTECYYLVTEDRNLILAVKEQDRIPLKLTTDDLFFRVYSNAFYHSNRCDPSVHYVDVDGIRVTNTNMILAKQNKYNDWQSLPGQTFAYVNGQLVDSINLFSAVPGDYVEIVYDGSVYAVKDFEIADLDAFTSTLDNKNKYLLHYPGAGTGNIDYQDDLEVYLIKKAPNGRFKGIYYHRNNGDSFRMVTHKDYAICAPYVEALISNQAGWSVDNATARVFLRHSGYQRPLVNENNRIKELYKMADGDVVRAMLGMDSNVSNWRAEVLEAAGYTRIMRSMSDVVDRTMVQDAYGYNAITKLLADTPSFVTDLEGVAGVDVPYGLQTSCMAYEYDVDGKLLGYYQHYSGTIYAVHNPQAKLVEMIAGVGGNKLDEIYGGSVVSVDPVGDYRYYVCPIESGAPNNEWVDVTGTDKVNVVNGIATWNVDPTRWYTLVRGNRAVLAYGFDHPMEEGLLKFSFVTSQNRGGTPADWVMQIPVGEFDLFLNKHSLIEGIDYVIDFPEVVIFTKKYLDDPENKPQRIDIRGTGFCRADLTRENLEDKGFIRHGLLSSNNRFDIRDDKVLRMIVGGALYERSELEFAESDSGVTVPDASNGLPYLIRDIVVPTRGQTTADTYTLRAASRVIDKQISDYLSMKVPEPVNNAPNVILDKYRVFSPFCAKILFDLQKGDLVDPRIQSHYGDSVVFEICAPYEYLLKYDPTQPDNAANEEFVRIEPHHLDRVVQIDAFQYKFLSRVIKLYLRDKTSLSSYVSLSV